jgi:hypothetical protein
MLTIDEVAERARISRTSLYRLRAAGEGPVERRLGRSFFAVDA